METYIVTAKTVEEAYAIANREYADGKHEVSCEVIEMPKKGFLGIGSKEARIKVTVTSSASAELGSVVADMRGMKKYTDRGGDGEQPKPQKKQNNQNNQKKPNDAKSDGQNQNNRKQSEPQKQGQNPQKKQDKPQQNKQNNEKNKSEKPAAPAEKEAAPAKESKSENKPKSALHNGARQNVRPQIKHIDGANVSGASVTVGSPMGLTDFVSENKQTSFGSSSSSSSSGRMSNDIRKKKPSKPMVSADKADEKLLRSKYDMAESDDDYKNIESMIRDDEAQLEKEAGLALGFSDNTANEEAEPAPAPRKREPITQAEMDYALEFANMLLTNMNLTAKAVQCECPEGEEFETNGDANVYPKIEIVGDDTGILIGHHGETLDAIQYLVNLSSLRKSKSKEGDYVRIVVDIENYREKRAETLRALARRMASKAVKYKRNVFLEPMNAYERRIIHSELQSYPNVSTHSVGTDRDRKIIITYEGADKQPDNRQHRRKGQKPASRPQKSEQAGTENAQPESAERRRPRKIQKVPIEKLTDILDGNASFLDGAKTEE